MQRGLPGAGEPTNNAGMSETVFLLLALGLAVIATLFRFVTTDAAVHRSPVVVDRAEPDPYNTPEFYRLLNQDGPFDKINEAAKEIR